MEVTVKMPMSQALNSVDWWSGDLPGEHSVVRAGECEEHGETQDHGIFYLCDDDEDHYHAEVVCGDCVDETPDDNLIKHKKVGI